MNNTEIRTKIKDYSSQIEKHFMLLSDKFPTLLNKQGGTSLEELRDVLMKIGDGNNESSTKEKDLFTGYSNKYNSLFEELNQRIKDLEEVNSHVKDIKSDSEEMELIALNAMVISIKSGEKGRAFSAITENLKRLSTDMILYSNNLISEEKRLLESITSVKQIFGGIVDSQKQLSALGEKGSSGIQDLLVNASRPLEEMKGIKLMNRIDTKFVTTRSRLMLLLDLAMGEYRVQQTKGERNIPYRTTYWDTDDFDMYRVHQTGHCGRQKLRFRTYVNSDLQFMEVKTKNNRGRTKKKRIQVDDMNLDDADKLAFLKQHLRYDVDTLRPAIQNEFRRITLVNRAKTERLTIDNALRFNNLVSGQQRDMGDLVIIELKRDGLCYSPVLNMLLQLRIMPHGFSKYCMGSAMTNPQLPVNRFKPKLRDVERILRSANEE